MLERNVGKVNLDNARVVVANLTVVGHLPYLVQALEHAGLLHKWYVGAYPKKLSRGILSLPRIRGRRKVDINDDKIQNYWWFELLRGSAARLSARHFEFYESIRLYCLEQFGRSVANEIRREKPDIVIGTNYGAARIFEAAQSVGALSILSQRTLFYQTVYEDLMERIRRGEAVNPIWSESRWRQLIRGSRSEAELADYILCPSKAVADSFVQNGTSPDKLILLPYGVDTTRFDEVKIESSDGDRFRILFVGRISRAKGVHELIEAFRDLNASDAELVLVGRDTGEIDIASLQNEMKNVRHLGWLPSAQLNEVYMRSDLFICPSLYEGAGNVIYEAMLAGLPVIVGRAGSSAVEDGVTGFVLNDVHAPELRSKIEYLYRQRELRKSVGQNARETMRKRSWETYQLHVRRIVTELCQSHTQ